MRPPAAERLSFEVVAYAVATDLPQSDSSDCGWLLIPCVLARPGKPSSKTLLSARSAMINRSTTHSWPITAWVDPILDLPNLI